MKPPTVVNIRAAELRKRGYQSLEDWLAASDKHVYIGRRVHYVPITFDSLWMNPYRVSGHSDEARNEAVNRYAEYLSTSEELLEHLHELDGCELGCWCAPARCHGDVLRQMFILMFK